MPGKIRSDAINAVGAAFLPIEATVRNVAIDASRCVATMLEAQQRARLGARFTTSIDLTAEAAQHLTAAANCLLRAHQQFAADAGDLGYGPYCPVAATPAELSIAA
jgi:hypothetical protein